MVKFILVILKLTDDRVHTSTNSESESSPIKVRTSTNSESRQFVFVQPKIIENLPGELSLWFITQLK